MACRRCADHLSPHFQGVAATANWSPRGSTTLFPAGSLPPPWRPCHPAAWSPCCTISPRRKASRRTRRDFIANVSHELRTPLTSIQGYAETLLDGVNSDETLRDFLEIIRKNAQRMARLTEDLLILARVESGDKKLQLRPVAAAELLHDASDYFHDHRADSGMTLEVVNEALKMVSADRDAVFQVFSNLIDNASKYASQGGRILIGAHDIEGFVQFYVRDFGPGIPSEHLPRLFERFYRVDKARSRESGGTGLGLAIAKHIMLAHGGSITAESELNHGCTFVFSLLEARVSPV